MYATGIGLVIEGIDRYLRDKAREKAKGTEKIKLIEKEEKESRKPKEGGFLKRIQDWFEGDDV
jgi:hypothetical protein